MVNIPAQIRHYRSFGGSILLWFAALPASAGFSIPFPLKLGLLSFKRLQLRQYAALIHIHNVYMVISAEAFSFFCTKRRLRVTL